MVHDPCPGLYWVDGWLPPTVTDILVKSDNFSENFNGGFARGGTLLGPGRLFFRKKASSAVTSPSLALSFTRDEFRGRRDEHPSATRVPDDSFPRTGGRS